jgi:hypothetical protein
LELHIDQLILHDVDSLQRRRIAAAIEQALTQMFAEQGVPGDLNTAAVTIDSSTIHIGTGASADVIGAQVAQSIYRQIGGNPQPTDQAGPNTK